MITNVFFTTTILFLALLVWLLQECAFLIPYRDLLLTVYAPYILAYAAVLFANVFVAVYFVVRKLMLKETGKKLAHLEKQLRTGHSISDELTEHLKEQSL
ncbi:MAG: hypothetical protein NTZ56_12500 [Acidobacteria bacterium]|jgi:hypothetical protein|nr:hypothetical protein [Acidobacteriota bacterium]